MNDAGVAPPGVTPIQQPIKQARTDVAQYLGNSFQVSITSFRLMRPFCPLKARPSSMVSKISPMPKRPMTAIKKSKPLSKLS